MLRRCLAHERASGFMDAPSLSTMPVSRSICFWRSSFDLAPHFPINFFASSEHPDSGELTLQSDVPPAPSMYCCKYSLPGPSSVHR